MKRIRKPLALMLGGAFGTHHTVYADTCSPASLVDSSEEIQIDRERGIGYLSVLNWASFART